MVWSGLVWSGLVTKVQQLAAAAKQASGCLAQPSLPACLPAACLPAAQSERHLGWQQSNTMYTAYQKFYAALLRVRLPVWEGCTVTELQTAACPHNFD